MVLLLALLLHAAAAAAAAATKASCPAGTVEMGTAAGRTVCEDLSRINGSMVFTAAASGGGGGGGGARNGSRHDTWLHKRLYAQNTAPTFGNVTGGLRTLNEAEDDLLGKKLLALAAKERRDVSLDEVLNVLPAIKSGWGSNPRFDYDGQHTFTGSRESSVDVFFDHKGDCGQWSGYPRPLTVIAEKFDQENVSAGLLGGELPILLWSFPVLEATGAGCRWEMAAAPVADVQHSHEQPVFFRFMRVCAGQLSGPPLYFDTNIYTPDYRPDAEAFYTAVLGQRTYWSATWAAEQLTELRLPSAPGTDGAVLVDQAKHSLLRDMITRVDTWFPRYGITPGYGAPTNNGFQEVFTASLSGALELGAHAYARGVLENYLRYYLKQRGTIAYRGLEMAQSGRMLSLFAQYWRFTRDGEILLKYFDKIQGIVELLDGRRQRALAAHPVGDPLRGMPIGHDEADLFVTWAAENPSGNHTTELPFFSIASEYWRGLVDLGAAWKELGGVAGNATVTAAGERMEGLAPPLLTDLRAAMVAAHHQANGTCWPYVAGRSDCAELSQQASSRDSEPWRTYAEMCWSGMPPLRAAANHPDTTPPPPQPPQGDGGENLGHSGHAGPSGRSGGSDGALFLSEMIEWNRHNAKSMRLGMLSGTGSDASGNSLMTFTGIGWGYGLLLADKVETFLLQLWTVATHANTRGTWTAPEEADISGGAMPYATSSQMVMPIHLKWMLAWEHPNTQALWLGRALPRAWLAEGLGSSVAMYGAASSWGRFSFELTSHLASTGCIDANITLHGFNATRLPPGGVTLRLRTPGARQIASVSASGKPLPPTSWNASGETVSFGISQLLLAEEGREGLADLQRVHVCYA